MKRFAFAAALAVFAVSLSFGDDAEVLPNGVARLRLVPSFTTSAQVYDKAGAAQKNQLDDTVTLLGANGAFEFGITEAITFGLKWAPGYTYSSTTTKDANKHFSAVGPADLELGGKIQVLGAKGLMPAEQLRLAITPGLSLPLDAYDAKAEAKKYFSNENFRAGSSSAHESMGFGAKADFDYVINENFFINLHGQALYYLPSESVTFKTHTTNTGAYLQAYGGAFGPTYTGNAANSQAFADAVAPLTKTKKTHGLEYTAEFEPHGKFSVGGDSSVNLGVPFVYEASLADEETYNGTTTTEKDLPTLLTVSPWVSFFTLIGPLPVEFQVQYSLPVLGTNDTLASTLSAQLKLFYKFY